MTDAKEAAIDRIRRIAARQDEYLQSAKWRIEDFEALRRSRVALIDIVAECERALNGPR